MSIYLRATTLLASIVVAISCGSNYVFSAYAPQLSTRLGINHTSLNLVGLAANLGVYGSGPVWGAVVDRRGPRALLVVSSVLLFWGYFGLRWIYNTQPAHPVLALMFHSLLTGVGGSAGLTAVVNTTAKSFPHHAHASATAAVFSGFGISAFLFSSIAHGRDTSALLLLLSLGTSIPPAIGVFLIRPVPIAVEDVDEDDDDRVPLLPPVDVSGRALFKEPNFWILFAVKGLLAGTGLMWINNVGSVARALEGNYDGGSASKWQAQQVSIISVANFSGRIFMGLFADVLRHHYQIPRVTCLSLVAILFVLSQISALSVSQVADLWHTSVLLGFAYGGAFALLPAVCIEFFGMPHFSRNWGFIALSPVIGANLFSIVFGRNLDAHGARCTERKGCYVSTLWLTLAATMVALGLSIWVGRRRASKMRISL